MANGVLSFKPSEWHKEKITLPVAGVSDIPASKIRSLDMANGVLSFKPSEWHKEKITLPVAGVSDIPASKKRS
jgi:hypothetical protein